jgi:addiction module RelB/DinJ family antitoxin
MAKTATVRASMHPQKKENVSKILKRLGLNHSKAINVFYSLIEEYNGLPFEVRLPSSDTPLKFKPRPEVMKHLDESIKKNRHLGELLAK